MMDKYKTVMVIILSIISLISTLSSSSSSVSAYDFGDEVCNGVHVPDYLQDAAWDAMNNVLNVARDNVPKNYLRFCADGTKDIYTMHSYATCATSDGCYDCLHDAADYLLKVCGDRLGAHVYEKESRHCYISFENYYIFECAKTS